jgi:hypothetical protein
MSKVRALRGARVTTQNNIGRKTEFDYPRGSLCPFFLGALAAPFLFGYTKIYTKVKMLQKLRELYRKR